MSKMVQVRNVPDTVHRKLKARAAEAGMSLSDYLLREMEQLAKVPTQAEMLARLAKLEPVAIDRRKIVAAVRSGRERR